MEIYCPYEYLSDVLMFEITGFKGYDANTGEFNKTKMKKAYLKRMQRNHWDKQSNIDERYNYSREEATIIATQIEQAYRILACDDHFADYFELGQQTFNGKEWAKEEEDGQYFPYSGRTSTIINWGEAEWAAQKLTELDTPLSEEQKTPEEEEETEIIEIDCEEESEREQAKMQHHKRKTKQQQRQGLWNVWSWQQSTRWGTTNKWSAQKAEKVEPKIKHLKLEK